MRVLLLSLVACAAAMEGLDAIHKFQEFNTHHAHKYATAEEMLDKLKIFMANLVHLEMAKQNDKTAQYSHLSPLMTMSKQDFNARNALKPDFSRPKKLGPSLKATMTLPESFDWRTKGAVNPVKDQAQCGSCWAFGTVANIEGVRVVQGKETLLSLSEQELVDCSASDNGCNGGLPDRAFGDLIDNNQGLTLESEYGYTAQEGQCEIDQHPQKVFISDYQDISQDEDEIAAALMQYGPLVIGINATPMQFYFGGISNPSDCDPSGIDHAVTLVGFGEEDGQKYWIIRNSWAASWGEDGYYRLVRGEGKCGMNRMISTSIMKPTGNFYV